MSDDLGAESSHLLDVARHRVVREVEGYIYSNSRCHSVILVNQPASTHSRTGPRSVTGNGPTNGVRSSPSQSNAAPYRKAMKSEAHRD